jgi:hypothetical protein
LDILLLIAFYLNVWLEKKFTLYNEKVEEKFEEHSNVIRKVQHDTQHTLHSSLLSLQIESIVDIEQSNVNIPKLQESLQVEYYIRNITGVPLYYWLPGQV